MSEALRTSKHYLLFGGGESSCSFPAFLFAPNPKATFVLPSSPFESGVPVPLPLSLLSTNVDEILANPGRGAGEAFAGVEDGEPVGVNPSPPRTCWVPAGRVMNPLEDSSEFCC